MGPIPLPIPFDVANKIAISGLFSARVQVLASGGDNRSFRIWLRPIRVPLGRVCSNRTIRSNEGRTRITSPEKTRETMENCYDVIRLSKRSLRWNTFNINDLCLIVFWSRLDIYLGQMLRYNFILFNIILIRDGEWPEIRRLFWHGHTMDMARNRNSGPLVIVSRGFERACDMSTGFSDYTCATATTCTRGPLVSHVVFLWTSPRSEAVNKYQEIVSQRIVALMFGFYYAWNENLIFVL